MHLFFWESLMGKKAVGNFGLTGWSTTPSDMVKSLLKSYRVSNANEAIIYKPLKSLSKSWQMANHDPFLLAEYISKDLEILFSSVFDRVSVVCSASEGAGSGGAYGINISVIVTENGVDFDLHTILKSDSKDLFEDYDQTYFDFKF